MRSSCTLPDNQNKRAIEVATEWVGATNSSVENAQKRADDLDREWNKRQRSSLNNTAIHSRPVFVCLCMYTHDENSGFFAQLCRAHHNAISYPSCFHRQTSPHRFFLFSTTPESFDPVSLPCCTIPSLQLQLLPSSCRLCMYVMRYAMCRN